MKNIAIIFDLDENWIGGSYYFKNLISALGMLPEEEKPMLTLLSDKVESIEFMLETGYSKLGWIELSQFQEAPDNYPFDAIFPHPLAGQENRTISWIPDFQELHLPYYFSKEEIANRRHHHRLRFATGGVVVSSEDAKADVERFYPGECSNVAVVHFATFNHFDTSQLADVKSRYGLPERYIMCANQVWVHKNHVVVLKALALLKTRGIDVTVCFTGNESDYRVNGYIDVLKALTKEWGVADRVRFLGFIPREDQLVLMNGADYVVQPSLFEGWSTVIEDAKAMGQFVVASDLPVHFEQLKTYCRHFPRHNPHSLADIMAEYAYIPPERPTKAQYDEARLAFGRDFLRACTQFLSSDSPPRSLSLEDLERLSQLNMSRLQPQPLYPEQVSVSVAQLEPEAPVVSAKEVIVTDDIAFIYYQNGNYSQVKVVRQNLPGPETLIFQKNNDKYSIEFKVSSFSKRSAFESKHVQPGDDEVYRIFFNNNEKDMRRRFKGLSEEALVLLDLAISQDGNAIVIQSEDSFGDARELFKTCCLHANMLFDAG